MRWGLHHQCSGYVAISVTEQPYQHLISLNTLEELSQFQIWTIFFLNLTSGLDHIKNCFSRSILGAISVGNRGSCNCVQCGDEGGGAICCRPPKCVLSQWWDPQLVHQVEIWRERSWLNSLPSTLSSTLTRISSFYLNIKSYVTILCTLPVTSCTAMRFFSGLKRIKTVLRSSLNISQAWLYFTYIKTYLLTSKKSLMSSPDRHPRWIKLSDSTR